MAAKVKRHPEAATRHERASAMEEQVRAALRHAVNTSGQTRTELAKQLGQNRSFLSMLLPPPGSRRAPTSLRLVPLFELLDVLGADPMQFLATALTHREHPASSPGDKDPSDPHLASPQQLAAQFLRFATHLLEVPAASTKNR